MGLMSRVALAAAILAAALVVRAEAKGSVTATGHGVVKAGADLVLTYAIDNGGEPWDRCYWFFYRHDGPVQYCSFDMDTDTQEVKLHKCSPKELSTSIAYTGTKKTECAITVKSVTEKDNATWGARLDDELKTTDIDVMVAVNVTSVSIGFGSDDVSEGSIEAGGKGNITCTVKGGRPAPAITIDIKDFDKAQIVNDTQMQTPDKDGLYESLQTYEVIPKKEDHGKTVTCQGAIIDHESGKPLFDMFKTEAVLNVTFAPQKADNQTVKVAEGKTAELKVAFTSNPAPTEIKWFVITKDPIQEDFKEVSLSPGHNDDKFAVSQIQDLEGLQFSAMLTIKQVVMTDEETLFRMEATNAVGVEWYFFFLDVTQEDVVVDPTSTSTSPRPDGDETTTGSSTEEPPSSGPSGGTIFAVIAVICILAIIIGAVFVYKKRMARNETAPLHGGR